MGSGFGSVSFAGLINAIGELLQAAAPEGFRIETRTVPLSDLEKIWTEGDSRHRIVFTP